MGQLLGGFGMSMRFILAVLVMATVMGALCGYNVAVILIKVVN